MVRPLSNDSRYTEWLENTFHSADFVRNLSYLMLAFKVALETKVSTYNLIFYYSQGNVSWVESS